MPKKWFTLVELIVVVTILSILSAIWFVAYSWYLAGTRDSNRISQLKAMADGLKLYKTKASLPKPDNFVEIKWSWELIAYQWYIWKNVLDLIEYQELWVDPKDKTYFSYYLTEDREYFQLMAFLEEDENLDEGEEIANVFSKVNAWELNIDYSIRYPKVYGDKLWILTNKDNVPLQEISDIVWSWYLDVFNTNNEYIARFDDKNYIIWTWAILKNLKLVAYIWWNFSQISSCKNILESWLWKKLESWYYTLFLDNWFYQVYCDMSIAWGWWTRYAAIKWDYNKDDIFNCIVEWEITDNDRLFCISPFKFNLNTTWEFMIKNESNDFNILKLKKYKDTNSEWISYKKRDYFDCSYRPNFLNYTYCRLWLNYDSNDYNYQQWGYVYNSTYDSTGYRNWYRDDSSVKIWRAIWWRSSSPEKFQFFVR